jgi:hypothetical protein
MPMKSSFVALALVVGLTASGCMSGSPQTSSAASGNTSGSPQAPGGPTNTKVNPAGPFPIVGQTVSMEELKQIGLIYQQFLLDGKGPAKLEDLNLKRDAPKLHEAIEEKRLILYWNVSLNNAPEGTSNTVLGYSAEVPTKGGPVLMLDGTVKKMTADEFAKAAKAGK